MSDDNRSSENPRRRPIGVPRRFAVGTGLIILTMYSVLFGMLKWADVDPVLFAIVSGFITVVGVAQMVLFRGRRPRDASFVAGGVLFPSIILTVIIVSRLSDGNAKDPLSEPVLFLSFMMYCGIVGVVLGYLSGCATASVFLILHRIDESLHGPRSEEESDDSDTPRRPPRHERWYDRVCNVFSFLWPYHRERPIGDAAALFAVVLLLAGPTASFPDWDWSWWVHLLGVAAAGLLLAMLYTGVRLCGWLGLVAVILLGGVGSLSPNALLPRVFFFTDQPLGEYVPWWFMALLGCLFGFFVLTMLAVLRWLRAGTHRPYVRRSRRAAGAAVVLLAVVYAGTSIAMFAVSKKPRQRALATVYRLNATRSPQLLWSTEPLVDVLLSEEASDDDLECLAALQELTGLSLSGSRVTDAGLAHLKNLTQLEAVWLDNTRVTGSGLRHLRGNTKLHGLRLTDSQVTDEGLASLEHFPNIGYLSLAGTNVTDAALHHLRNYRSLWDLDLSNTQVTGTGFASLAEQFRRQEDMAEDDPAGAVVPEQQAVGLYLCLDDAPVTDTGLIQIGKVQSIKVLRLRDTKVTDDGLVHLAKLANLCWLDLSATQVTGRGLQHLKGLANLSDVRLDATPTDDAGLAHLGQLSNLYSVSLAGTKITDAGLVHLKGLKALDYLDLADTSITDAGLENLEGILSLENVDLSGTDVSTEAASEFRRVLNDHAKADNP